MLFYAEQSSAQGGSNYSIFGIGDINHSVGAKYEGLAGTSIAYPSVTGINLKNPAMWSISDKTRLQVGYKFNQRMIDNSDQTLFQNNGGVDGLLALLKIDDDLGAAVSFGIFPYSHVNYLSRSEISSTVDDLEIKGNATYEGQGGLSAAYLGFAIMPIQDLAVGISGITTFGKISNNIFTEFYTAYSYNSINAIEQEVSGFGYRAGLSYLGIENLSFGMFIEQISELSVNVSQSFLSGIDTDTTLFSESAFEIPMSYGFGAAYKTGKFMIGADVSFQDFSAFTFNSGANTTFKNSMLMSVGVERLGSKNFTTDYLDKVSYKFGLGYKDLYYQIYGENINEIYGSFGMEFPLRGAAVIDAAVVIGTRGTTNNNLLLEGFGRLIVDISIGETWFKPFRLD